MKRKEPVEQWWASVDISNRSEAVRQYYLTHIGCTQEECAAALGINRRTVYRHLKTIREEWPVEPIRERRAA